MLLNIPYNHGRYPKFAHHNTRLLLLTSSSKCPAPWLQGTRPCLFARMQVDMAISEEEEVVELNVHSFDLLEMTQQQAAETQEAWEMFLQCYESIEVAGEALHDAIIDASPTLTTLFTMPRAVTSMRLQEGIHQIINSLTEPQDVKNLVARFEF